MTIAVESPKTTSLSPSTDRALDLLEALSAHRGGLNLSELARATELPQNSVFRIANAMHARGYLHRRESDKRFTLSNRFFDLGRPQVNEKSLVVCALESLRELREETGETTQLMVRSGHKGVVLEQVSGRHAVQVMGKVGMLVPLYSCAPGKAMLSHLPEAELDEWLEMVTLKPFTPTTCSTRKTLLANLAKARQVGYATDFSEGLEGIHCVAAPIFNEHHYPVAALTVMAPTFRLPKESVDSLGTRCIAAATKTQDRLFC